MVNVITATQNEKLNELLNEVEGVHVIDKDYSYQEILFDHIQNIEADILILTDTVDGAYNKAELLDKILEIRNDIKLIYLLKDFDDVTFQRKLRKNDINDIYDYENLKMEKLANIILGDQVSIEKEKETKVKKVYIKVKEVESVFKKVITIYSPTSEGSSRVAAHLAHAIASSKKCKVILLDFNPIKPIQRELFDIKGTEFDYSLKDILEAIEKRSLSTSTLESFIHQSKYCKNLDVVYGLYDINEYYHHDSEEYFEEIIDKARFSYDYVIIDTYSFYDAIPSHVALKYADDVLVPVRGKKSSIDTVIRYLDNFKRYNDFDVQKFSIIINQYSGNDLTSIEISSMLNYPIIGYISRFKDYDELNGFKNIKLINEYATILKKIDVHVSKKETLLNKIANLFRRTKKNIDLGDKGI